MSADRFWDWNHTFDHPMTLGLVAAVATLLVLAPILNELFARAGLIGPGQHQEIRARWKSWLALVLFILVPVLCGPVPAILAVGLLGWLCFREFARATGLFRERTISMVVTAGILGLALASISSRENLYFAWSALILVLLAVITVPMDRPMGFLQRIALGTLAFFLFGHALGCLGLLANRADYRPLLLFLLLAVEMNDVFAYCFGKLLGRNRLVPKTSPGKTVAGAVGAFVGTSGLVVAGGYFLFEDTPLQRWDRLLLLGLLISGLGQMGDLMISAIKRDLGLKDLGVALPGHGGWLDRFDSLLLVAPAAYHFLAVHLNQEVSGSTRLFLAGH